MSHKWYAKDEDGNVWELAATSRAEAIREIQDDLNEVHSGDSTAWYDMALAQAKTEPECDSETWEYRTFTIDPKAPPCEDGEEHEWESPLSIVGGIRENPGVWGHGGGVKIQEVCLRCGCGRLRDTWAQRPDTGEQGLESVTYQPHYVESVAE